MNASYSSCLYVLPRNMCIHTPSVNDAILLDQYKVTSWWKLTLKCCISCEMDSKQHLNFNVVFNEQNLRHWKKRIFEELAPNMISFNVAFVFNRPASSSSSSSTVQLRLQPTFVFVFNTTGQIWDLSETLTFTGRLDNVITKCDKNINIYVTLSN